MITIQSYIKNDSITIFLDNDGIDEMIRYLNFIKKKDCSLHLSEDNELEQTPFDENMFVVPHLKILNTNKLENL